ncbi:hypothetical protein predicted by Glimmer/Critica [Salmonella enterica subsp. enterica serovar Weltevreden str. 2007-60-3289-1]|uniref:Uncharacterized protein n=1 Tax=Salmonella paratyphi B (strain ATCC BAA-1250 / SPB7) TaxID=1016998 RepID=A0A6C6Z1K6_SALPB|nr:hypothetical protein SPAB_01834 [Salmonella enterica subsp. enterica serovar Paratyphi B str. SPB7]CBY95814.1 hypothetical protein predicted by Glimmer/Critica [Salmonella enterica subsp. enterica serovar Weltevreden str. 2007-60-3289-1]
MPYQSLFSDADTNNNVMSVDLFWLKSNTSGKEVKIF